MEKLFTTLLFFLSSLLFAKEKPQVLIQDSKIQVITNGKSIVYTCTKLCESARLSEAKWNKEETRFYVSLEPTEPYEYWFRIVAFDTEKGAFSEFSIEDISGTFNASNDLAAINDFPFLGEDESGPEYKEFQKKGTLIKLEVIDLKNFKRYVIDEKKTFAFYPFFDQAGFLNYSNPKGPKGSLVKISPQDLRSKYFK